MASQRVLAAVVFTDAVGFSKLASENEEAALRLINADFAVMREAAVEFDGQVKKSLGDGLLMVFMSATQAVLCAVEMQRKLGETARKGDLDLTLRHRIGIHLGDVMITEDDAMGDGVNIASRLQREAQPGAICLSQTVYDIVKSKLTVQVKLLGEKYLKNISEPMNIYEIGPFFVARMQQKLPDIHRPYVEPERSNTGLIAAIAFAGLCILGATFLVVNRGRAQGSPAPPKAPIVNVVEPDDSQKPPLKKPGKSHKTPDLPALPADLDANDPAQADPLAAPVESKDALEAFVNAQTEWKAAYAEARDKYKSGYDFDGMLNWIAQQTWANTATGKRLAGHWMRLKHLRQSVLAALAKHTPDNAMKVGQDSVWLITGTLVGFRKGDAAADQSQIDFPAIQAPNLRDIAVAVQQEAGSGLGKYALQAFELEYDLPTNPSQ